MNLDTARDAFKEAPDTRAMRPIVSPPPIKGGLLKAIVGTQQTVFLENGKTAQFTVRERSLFPNANVTARCLGFRNDGQIKPCPYCSEAAVSGEDGLDLVRAEHPTEGQMRKIGAQHVLCLFSPDPVDAESYNKAKAEHDERVEAYKNTKSWSEKQAMLMQWSQQGVSDPRYPFKGPEIIGPLSDTLRDEE